MLLTRPTFVDTWNETTHTERQNTNIFQMFDPSATATYARQASPHYLLTFELLTRSGHLKTMPIVKNNSGPHISIPFLMSLMAFTDL